MVVTSDIKWREAKSYGKNGRVLSQMLKVERELHQILNGGDKVRRYELKGI